MTKDNMLGIYLDLDSLFDVKYAIIEKYYPHLAKLVIEDSSYVLRKSDLIESKDSKIKLPPYLIEILFKNRTKRDLANAKPTSIILIISSIINRLLETAQNGDDLKDINFIINTYPYLLTEKEQEHVAMFMGQFFKKYCEFVFIYKSPKEITSTWILESNIEFMSMYNFLWWLEVSSKKELFKVLIDHVKVMTPKLGNLIISSKEEFLKLDKLDWTTIEKICSVFVNLEFIDVSTYSPVDFLKIKKE